MIRRVWLSMVLCGVLGGAQQAVDEDAQIEKDFEKRVEDYAKLRDTARAGLDKLKPTKEPEKIDDHERGLARRIRELRAGARQGDIFTPEISGEFRRLIGITLQGEEAARILKSLERAEPVHLKTLEVDRRYPDGVPLQSTPPTLLLNLPKLPKAMEYRVTGRALILHDMESNLIVDFIADAFPARKHVP